MQTLLDNGNQRSSWNQSSVYCRVYNVGLTTKSEGCMLETWKRMISFRNLHWFGWILSALNLQHTCVPFPSAPLTTKNVRLVVDRSPTRKIRRSPDFLSLCWRIDHKAKITRSAEKRGANRIGPSSFWRSIDWEPNRRQMSTPQTWR